MLIARAPVRLSFAGGGTDLEDYYVKYGGAVLSTTIDKYFYVFLSPCQNENVQVTSSDYRTFYRFNGEESLLWDDDLRLPLTILSEFGITRGVSMFLASEIPPGTGLGSSSTVTVAIIKAVSVACGLHLSRQELAELACYVEINKLGMPIGKQDQYAAAFGGLNFITFTETGVHVQPLKIPWETRDALERNILLFFTGSARKSSAILSEQKRSTREEKKEVISALHAVKAMALEAKQSLEKGDVRRIGELLHLNWQHKKRFASGITNPFIDECYELALKKGALGGKITGAGGGGFLMLYCEEPYQERVTTALEEKGLRRMDFRFETGGAKVLMNASIRLPLIRNPLLAGSIRDEKCAVLKRSLSLSSP